MDRNTRIFNDKGEEIFFQVLLTEEIEEWIQLITRSSQNWILIIIQKIVMLCLKKRVESFSDVDMFLTSLRQMRNYLEECIDHQNIHG